MRSSKVQRLKTEERRQKAFHHKDTKINTKGHKEDKRQEKREQLRRQKAQNTKRTKEGSATTPALSLSCPLLLNSVF
jgi:hypothetical protein